MRRIIVTLIACFAFFIAMAQNSDDQFQRTLSEIIHDLEVQYQVKFRFSDSTLQPDSMILKYANWRYRPDFDQTMQNVLAPFDLICLPDGDNKYKIEGFRYHRRSVDEAKEFLDHLASLYNNKTEWEERREEMIPCLRKAIRLDSIPEKPDSKVILINKRSHDGYQVENFSIEVLPGVYTMGSIYRPAKIKGKIPVILCPIGHFGNGRYNEQIQYRCAGLAKMGAIVATYDLFAWQESRLQFDSQKHRSSYANTMQALNSFRILDYLLSFKYADTNRVGITGASGGGSHTMLMAAIDSRIDVSVPTAMLSAIHYGGCPCESGNPIHFCGGGTNNVEIAALVAPKPMLVISDGGDWTSNVPELEFPLLEKIYKFYGEDALLKNAHFANEGHDYGRNKREAMYRFMAKHLQLDKSSLFDEKDQLNESTITIESQNELKVFGDNGEYFPKNAVEFETLKTYFK